MCTANYPCKWLAIGKMFIDAWESPCFYASSWIRAQLKGEGLLLSKICKYLEVMTYFSIFRSNS
jgi:hypothetical protein